MSVVPILVAFSLFLATCAVALFLYSTRNCDHEHADRLSLLPLEDDLVPAADSSELRTESQPSSDD